MRILLRNAFLFYILISTVFAQTNLDTLDIRIKAITGMQYDQVRFRVEPGRYVRLILENTDEMEHNLVIGKKGAEIDVLKAELKKLTGKDVWIEVEEVKRPDLDARLVAEGIAKQLERRVAFRRAMKKGIQSCLDAGAAGVKVRISGRLGGAEIARSEWYKEGRIPLHTLRADIDFALATAQTPYGIIGVKVWINRGDDIVARPAVAASA